MTAAALPEVACTVWSNVFMIAGLQPDETFLVHGGAGGIGTFAIQLGHAARRAGLHHRPAPRRSSPLCAELGADVTINYRDQDFVEVVREETDGAGADVILDNMGAKYLGRNVDALATEGRLVIIGMQGGTKGELDLGKLLRKRGAVIAATLRGRPVEEKAAICASVVEHVWPLVADGLVRADRARHACRSTEVAEAHRLMEAGEPHRQDRAHRLTARVGRMSEQPDSRASRSSRSWSSAPTGSRSAPCPPPRWPAHESDADGDDDERARSPSWSSSRPR